jgi:protein pelota
VAEKSDVGVFLIEDGKARAYFMKTNFSLFQGSIEKSLPRKKNSMIDYYKKAISTFQGRCLEMILNIFDLDTIKCFIVAGPGNSPNNFVDFIKSSAERSENAKVRKNLSKFLVISASSAQQSALNEIMEDASVQKLIGDTRALKETQILTRFLDTIRTDPNKVGLTLNAGCVRGKGGFLGSQPSGA